MPQQGRAAVLDGAYGQPYRFYDHPVEQPGIDQALIKLDYSGVCHGDVYSRDGGGPAPDRPFRPLTGGHEGIGHIIALGERSGSGNQPFKLPTIGDRVGIAWRRAVCGVCDACEQGRENFCAQQVVTGMKSDGTFQSYIVFPLDQLHRIPSALDSISACSLLCAGVTAYTSLQQLSNVASDKWIAVVGAGGALGHLAIQYAKTLGLKVLAIDGGDASKQDLCREVGADHYIDFPSAGPSLAEEVKIASGGGVHYTAIFSPHQSCYDDAGEYTRFGGQIIGIGVGNCSMRLRPLLQKAITVQCTQTGTKADMQVALTLGAEGKVKCKAEVLFLEDLNVALDRIRTGKVLGKLVIDLRH